MTQRRGGRIYRFRGISQVRDSRWLRFALPYAGLEREMPVATLRGSISGFAQHSGLCYALLSGMAAAALFRDEDEEEEEEEKEEKSNKHMMHMYSQGLFTSALFVNLQGLMSSMLVLGWSNAMPDKVFAEWASRSRWIIASSGWWLVPGKHLPSILPHINLC